jgi:hypothetical protein
MSEREPNQPKRYYLEYNGKRYILNPDNTVLYLHSNNPACDHYYVQFDDDEDGEQRGHYGWRQINENFDEMILNLVQVGCEQVLKPDPSHFDLEQYKNRFGHLPESEPVEQVAPQVEHKELEWISPRRQREIDNAIGFLVFLAERNRL